ncbi:MAG: SDR family oxidoreductase [Clostridia bacterium]|nr:SDR family oxidoreductase [Clostridia bacterium]
MFDFSEKTAFLTGAARGIGRAIALGLAKGGAKIVLCDINEEALAATAREAEALGAQVLPLRVDVACEEAVRAAIKQAEETFGKIDILINNAGIYPVSDFVESKSEDWKRMIDINILGTMYACHAALPGMLARGYGRIVNIGSVAGHYGLSYFVDYSMTKGAIISFTRALAKAVTPKGVTVNCVSPGSIDVNGIKKNTQHSFTGREGTPEECASVVLFLASDEASYVSGQEYLVDGCRKLM